MTPVYRSRRIPFLQRALCLLLVGLTACSTTSRNTWKNLGTNQRSGGSADLPALEAWGGDVEGPEVTDPVVVPGFLLELHSTTDAKLSGDYRVDFNGDVQLPYDVVVNTSRTRLSQLQKKVSEAYHAYFKSAPTVEVKVKERRYWIDVRGLVQKPGRFLVEQESSLDQVIGLADGLTKESPPQFVRIQKGKRSFVFDLNLYYSQGENRPQILGWEGGEVLFFQKGIGATTGQPMYRTPIYFMGEVRKPGEYILNSGADFVDTLTQAGGFTERADLDDIQIVRRTGGTNRTFHFRWKEFQKAPTPIQGDVFYVHADNITKGERRANMIALVVGVLASVVTAAVLALSYNRGRI